MATDLRQQQAARLPSLTGIRFVAAMLVFATHVALFRYISGPTGDAIFNVFSRSGYFAVSFFFLLSGFVLTWATPKGDRVRSIWRRRMVKIFPNHLVTFGLTAVLMLIAADKFMLKGTIANLFLVQSWFTDIRVPRAMNQVTWSLSCELFSYLCFPLLLWVFNRTSVARLRILAVALVALTFLAPVFSQLVIGGRPLPPAFGYGGFSYEQVWFIYLFPPVRFLEFVLGMVIAKLVFSGAWPRIGVLPASVIALGGYVYIVSVPTLFRIGGSCVVFLVPLIAALATADIKGTTSPFRGRIMVWLGDLTYAFYILHTLVLTYSFRWLVAGKHLSPGVAALLLLGMFVLSLVLSWVLFRFVEQPMMRRFSRPRRKPPVSEPVPTTPAPALAVAQATE